jgi:putative holliday junction resolvase
MPAMPEDAAALVPAADVQRPKLPPSPALRQYLAFDPGKKRIGVASGNSLTLRGQPLVTLEVQGDEPLTRIDPLVAEWRPDALVVGVPRHPDGTPHVNTKRALRFAHQLLARYRLPVHPVDERYSTVEAQRANAGSSVQGLRAGVDAVAAAVILDQFFSQPTPALAAAEPLPSP